MRVATVIRWRPRFRAGAFFKASLLAALFALGATAQSLGDLTGTWILNVEKSSWGRIHRPASVVLTITHHEPDLDYSGAVLYTNEDDRNFAFHGAIDGKEYPMERSYGEGAIAIRRVDSRSIRSHFQTRDGRYSEIAITTLSFNGQRLTRRLHVQGPGQDATWTEVYDRQ